MKARNVALIALAGVVLVALLIANRSDDSATQREMSAHDTAHTPSPATPAPATTPGAPATSVVEAPAQRVPHFHARLEDALPLPQIMPASNFSIPVVARAYRIAARIPDVLAQQPCYCWCDKMGHGSLVDCFATSHGAGWAVCVKEVLLADQLTRAGLKPAEIREAIIRGDWENVSLQ